MITVGKDVTSAKPFRSSYYTNDNRRSSMVIAMANNVPCFLGMVMTMVYLKIKER